MCVWSEAEVGGAYGVPVVLVCRCWPAIGLFPEWAGLTGCLSLGGVTFERS